MSLIAIKGKLTKQGEVVPLEFGNLEQIKFVRDSEEREQILKDGFEVDYDFEEITTYDASFSFLCICGNKYKYERSGEEDNDLRILSNKTVKCSCKRTYTTSINKHDELILTLNQ